MKPEGPLKRKTGLRSTSRRRRQEAPERARVRREVLARDGGCRARTLAPGACSSPFAHRPPLEVHELEGGAGRSTSYLDPALCIAVCQRHHDWITANPAAAAALGLRHSVKGP